MPTKRKQPHGEPSTSSLSGVPLKKTKTNMQPASKVIPKAVPKRKHLADEHTNDASTTLSSSRPVKKARKSLNSAPAKQPTHSQPSSSSIALPSKKEKPVTQTHTQQATKVSKPSATLSSLIPQVPRQRATLGHKDESLLHIIGKSSVTGKRNDLHFRLIPHLSIDWNDAQHINKINSWRNQIYQRAGIKTRLITSWHPLEEIWMELYYQLSIVEAREREIQLPTPKQLRDAFNEIFVGRVLKDKYGGDLDPRSERHATAFGSKFNRMCPVLKARLSNCVSGKGGEGFLPDITFEMLQLYKTEKATLAEKGIKSDSEDADGMEEWQRFLSQLSSIADTETQDLIQEEGKNERMTVKENALTQEDQEDEEGAEAEEEEEDSDLAAKESDAIAALMSLANAPVVGASNEATSTAFRDGCATPALTRSARTSFSQAEDVFTPEQYDHSLEGTTYKCKMCDVNAVGALSSYERLWAPVGDQYLGE